MIKLGYIILFIFSSSIFLTSCQTYTTKNYKLREKIYEGNINEALKILDISDIASEKRNQVLYRMEKGMLLYSNGQFDAAIKLWIEASNKIDDLYTTSISNTGLSLVINDSMSDFEGEAHEKVLLPIFSSIAFFANDNLSNSQVMVKKTYDILNTLQNSNQGKNTFKYDAFSYYFSGMVYEAKKDWDSAIVFYRLALNNLNLNTLVSSNENALAKTEILKSLGRLGEFKKRNDILDLVKHQDSKIKWQNHNDLLNKGEVYIIYECGKSPIKIPQDFIFPLEKSTLRISFPVYIEQNYNSHFAEIFMNNKYIQKTITMENIGQMAKQALADRKARDFSKMIARVIAKNAAVQNIDDNNSYAGLAANIFSTFTEVADTRSWTSLPDNIQIARIPIEANQDTVIEVKPQAGLSQKFMLKLSPGDKKLYRFRTFN